MRVRSKRTKTIGLPSKVKWKFTARLVQLRTQGSFYPQLPSGGLSSQEEQDINQHFSTCPQATHY